MYQTVFSNQKPPVQVRIEKPIYVAGKATAIGDIVTMSFHAAQEAATLKLVTILESQNSTSLGANPCP